MNRHPTPAVRRPVPDRARLPNPARRAAASALACLWMFGLARGAVPASSAVVSLWAATRTAWASPPKADKEHWQKRYQELKAQVADLERELEDKRRIYSRKRHNRHLRGDARTELLKEIGELEKQLAKARADLEAFPDEARQAGALPGWFRDL